MIAKENHPMNRQSPSSQYRCIKRRYIPVPLLLLWGTALLFLLLTTIGARASMASPPQSTRDVNAAPAAASAPQTAARVTTATRRTGLELVQSNAQAIVVALTVDDYRLEAVEHEGDMFHQVVIPDVKQQGAPGHPLLPAYSLLLGVPTTAGLSVELLEAEFDTLTGYRIRPAPRLVAEPGALALGRAGTIREAWWLDPHVYAADAYLPEQPAHQGSVGYMREQAVAQLTLNPVQVNPQRSELRIYRRLVARLTWEQTVQAAAQTGQSSHPEFEPILRTSLYNYDSLPPASAGSVSAASVAAASPRPCQDENLNPARALKIGVDRDGIYQLTYEQLDATGWLTEPAKTAPQIFRLCNGETEIPLLIRSATPGTFAAHDAILFYGTANTTPYTDTNVYLLFADSEQDGKRMPVSTPPPVRSGTAITMFLASQRVEENTAYWQEMPTVGEDRWFWGLRHSPNTEEMPSRWLSGTFTLTHTPVDPTPTAVRVVYRGYSDTPHRTQIYLNNQLIGDELWGNGPDGGQIVHTQRVLAHSPLSLTALTGASNRLEVQTVETAPDAPIPDQILVNWFEVDYWAQLTARNEQLAFPYRADGPRTFSVDGFHSGEVFVLDVTTPASPTVVARGAPAGGRVEFSADITTTRDFALAGAEGLLHPKTVTPLENPVVTLYDNSPTPVQLDKLYGKQIEAEYIVITHRNFRAAADRLAQHRGASYRSLVVDINDIYNTFSGGVFTPAAIKRFLTYAYQTWDIKPLYVVLLGDAYQDYQNRLDAGETSRTANFVPSELYETNGLGEVSSDHQLSTIHGDDAWADVLIGRLSVENSVDADIVVNKIIAYDEKAQAVAPPTDDWRQRLLFVADDGEPIFTQTANALIHLVTTTHSYTVTQLYLSEMAIEDVRAGVVREFNRGSILINYTGHGDYKGWGVDRFPADGDDTVMFDTRHVETLTNTARLPVVTLSNCLNGFFAGDEDFDALAEVLQRRPGGGAVAIVAPTGLGIPAGHRDLMTHLYDEIFKLDNSILGVSFTQARNKTGELGDPWVDLVNSYVLLGDPAMKIDVFLPPPQIVRADPATGERGIPIDSDVVVSFSKPVLTDTIALTATAQDTSFIEMTQASNGASTVFTFSLPTRAGGPLTFKHGMTYTFTLRAEDKNQQPLAGSLNPTTWQVVISTDARGPVPEIFVRGDDQNNASAWSAVRVEFNEPVRPESVRCGLSPEPVNFACTLVWEADGKKARLVHDRLTVGQSYTFFMDRAKDITGNDMRDIHQLSFTVGPFHNILLPYIASESP